MTYVTRHPPGAVVTIFEEGDILLCRDRRQDWLTQLIQAGERARFGNTDWARWDHSGLIVSAGGATIEAEAKGIMERHITDHVDEDYFVVHVGAIPTQRALACAFAREQVGTEYGFLNFVGLAIQALTGLNLAVHMDSQFICSGLVARATEKYISSYSQSPDSMTPADLAAYWGIESGEALIPLGFFARFLDGLRTVSRTVFGKLFH